MAKKGKRDTEDKKPLLKSVVDAAGLVLMCIKEVWGIFREKGSRAPIKMQGGNMEQHISVVGLLIWALLRTRTRRLSSQNPSISSLWKQCESSLVEKKKGNGKRKTNDNNGWLIQERPLHINRVWTRKEFLQVTQQISSWWKVNLLWTLTHLW